MSESLIRSFVDLLWPPESRRLDAARRPEGYFSLWVFPSKKSLHYRLDDPELEIAAHELDQAGNNVFFGLGLRKADLGPHQRGKKEDIYALPGFWSDIDVQGLTHKADNLPASVIDVVTTILQPFPWEPTAVVSSGGGIHAYWLFEQPLLVTDENRAEVEEMSRVFQERLAMYARQRGWKWDMTADLPRVLRPVGTCNRKIQDRPVPVEFLGKSNTRYSYAMICQGLRAKAGNIASILGREDVQPPLPAPSAGAPPIPQRVDKRTSEEILTTLREKMKKNRKRDREEILKQILDGEPFAEMGERDKTLQRVCSWIGFYDMHADPEILAEVLVKSLDAMEAAQPDGAMTFEDAVEKIARAQADARRKSMIADSSNDAILRALQASARGISEKRKPPALTGLPSLGPGPSPSAPPPSAPGPTAAPTSPQTLTLVERLTNESKKDGDAPKATGRLSPDEIDAFRARQSEISGEEISWEQWKKRWVICYGDARYVFGGHGRYKYPIHKNNFRHSAPRDLLSVLPEWDKSGAYYFRPTEIKADLGLRLKNNDEILDEISTVARHLIADMAISEGYYHHGSETFYEAVSPIRRDLEARYDQNVQTWLELIGGLDTEKLLDWIATVTRLESPNCGLFMSGPPNVGKTLLANGLARLWHTGGYTRMEDMSGNFNSDIVNCPLVVADEALPEGPNGRPLSTRRIRDMISADTRTLKRKFMPNVTLRGSIRAMFLANSPRLFDLGDETLGKDSLQAVASRLLHIHVTPETAGFLASIGGRWGGTKNWINGDEIAMHALWLRDNRVVTPKGRFLVEGHASKMHENLATSSPVNAMVIEWILRHLIRMKPNVVASGGVIVGGGKLWANASVIFDFWGDYITNRGATTPALNKISKALEAFSEASKPVRRRTVKGHMVYWPLRTSTIIGWADENGLGDGEQIKAVIAGPTETGFLD